MTLSEIVRGWNAQPTPEDEAILAYVAAAFASLARGPKEIVETPAPETLPLRHHGRPINVVAVLS